MPDKKPRNLFSALLKVTKERNGEVNGGGKEGWVGKGGQWTGDI